MTEAQLDERHHTDRTIPIVINEVTYEVPDREVHGRELFALGHIPEENHLFLDVPGTGDDCPVGLDDEIQLRPHMCFYDVPVGNFG